MYVCIYIYMYLYILYIDSFEKLFVPRSRQDQEANLFT